MKFGYTILYVESVERSVEFYEKAFGLARRFVHESGRYAEMDTGETTLAFASNELAETNLPCGFTKNSPDAPPAGIEIALLSEEVAKAYERALAAGAVQVKAPESKPWGQVVAYVRDPDGVLVEIASPMSPINA